MKISRPSRLTPCFMPKLSCVHCDTSELCTLEPKGRFMLMVAKAYLTSFLRGTVWNQTVAVSSYHKQKARHYVTSFLHVALGPNDSLVLKLVMFVNKTILGCQNSKTRSGKKVPCASNGYYRAHVFPRISLPTVTSQGNTVHAWKWLKQDKHCLKASRQINCRYKQIFDTHLSVAGREAQQSVYTLRMKVQEKGEAPRNWWITGKTEISKLFIVF